MSGLVLYAIISQACAIAMISSRQRWLDCILVAVAWPLYLAWIIVAIFVAEQGSTLPATEKEK